MHDIVRDHVRSRLGGSDGIRVKQRAVVKAFAEACPADGFARGDEIGAYASRALLSHMKEGISADPLADTEAQTWLDASDNVVDNSIVRAAAAAFGHAIVVQLGEECEASGQLFTAAKRFAAAASTEELAQFGQVTAASASAGEGFSGDVLLLTRACDLLERTDPPTNAVRVLEVALRGHLTFKIPLSHPVSVCVHVALCQAF